MTKFLVTGLCFLSFACSGPPRSEPARLQAQHGSVELRPEGIYIDGRATLLRGGSLQWFRLPPEVWEDRLERFKAAGYNTIDVYVAWRNHEREEGVFDFTTHDLPRFLALAQKHGLFVYLRPGPYITNEMDAGGLPAWLLTRTSKRTRDAVKADGTINPRTNDRDWLDATGRWFHALDEVIKPYLHTNGGPIVMVAVENEYNWFLQSFDVDKLFDLDGVPERPADQVPDVAGYLGALRDLVRADGVDVPITTCPGDGTASAMDGVAGIVPMPNVYGGLPEAEHTAWSLLRSLHDPAQHGGQYVGFPTGISETERSATVLKRFVVAGMDAVFQFNAVGSHQEGRQNAVVLNGGAISDFGSLVSTIRRITAATPGTGFVRPPVGYFHNVVDYQGAIGPSGTLRPSFHAIRRANLFFDAFEPLLAAAGTPARTVERGWPGLDGADRRVVVHGDVGTRDKDASWRRVNYWLPLAGGAALLGLYHEGAQPIDLGREAIEAFGERFPRYSDLIVPAGEGGFTQLVPIRFPLSAGLTLDYATAEVLTSQSLGGEQLLIVHAPRGQKSELRLSGTALALQSETAGVSLPASSATAITAVITHGAAPEELVIVDGKGARTRVVALDSDAAGRTWWLPGAVVLIGPEWVHGGVLELETDHGLVPLWTISPQPVTLDGVDAVQPFDAATHLQRWQADSGTAPTIALPLTTARAHDDAGPNGWRALGDRATALEANGIYQGHAWLRAQVTLTAAQARQGGLWLDGASDFVGLYLNGHYLTTLAPLGTEVNSESRDRDYGFKVPDGVLHEGVNTLLVRDEIWGHGSFMWPRGVMRRVPLPIVGLVALPGVRISAPALGFDALKGVIGQGWLGGVELTGWELAGGLSEAFAGDGFDDTSWPATTVPFALAPGQVRWVRTSFRGDQLPDPTGFHAPAVVALSGRNAKATLYLNGRIIGRWLSDETWLRRGGWFQPTRSMWMQLSPDEFPIDRQMLRTGDNVLALAVEDTSDATRGEAPGTIDQLALQPARERRVGDENRAVSYRRLAVTLR